MSTKAPPKSYFIRHSSARCCALTRISAKAGDIPAVTSVVVAAGEVGSGTALASGGQHFSKLTPRGAPGRPDHQVRWLSV